MSWQFHKTTYWAKHQPPPLLLLSDDIIAIHLRVAADWLVAFLFPLGGLIEWTSWGEGVLNTYYGTTTIRIPIFTTHLSGYNQSANELPS